MFEQLQKTFAALAFAAIICGGCADDPVSVAVAPARRPDAPDGARAFANAAGLVEAVPSRDAGSDGARAAAEWIAGRLRDTGIATRIDEFDDDAPGGVKTFRNVVAELQPPKDGAGWIVILSHYDTKSGIPGFVGANDGASSVGLLIEMAARIGESNGDDRHGFLFACLDGEECRFRYGAHDGLHGSRHLARALKDEGRAVRAVVLLDMIGDRDLLVTIPRNGDLALTRLMLASADSCGLRDFFVAGDGGVLDDHQPFLDAGFPAIDLIDFRYGSLPGANDYWHTAEDTIDKISAESLDRVGRVVFEFIGRLGNAQR